MRRNIAIATLIAVSIFVVIRSSARAAEGTVDLKTAASFAVLAGSTVTNTGPTEVHGDLGVSPGSAVTGFGPGTVSNGTIHQTDGPADQAQTDLTEAYNDAAGRNCPLTPTNQLTGQDLGGLTLKTGVYCYTSSAQLTGTVTFDAENVPSAVFIVQIGSTLTTASSSVVNLVNGADACNVFWQVGSSATLGTATTFVGNILALTSITMTTSATAIDGRMLARNGAVTMDTNTIDRGACASAAATATPTATATASPTAAPTATPTATPTAAPTATPTAAPTATPTASPAPTATPAPTPTATPAATASPTPTPTATPSPTPLIVIPGLTPTPSPTSTPSPSPTQTFAPAATGTPGPTPTQTPVRNAARTPAPTASPTPTVLVPSDTTSQSQGRPGLPRTGVDIEMFVLVALGLIAVGELLRQWARSVPR